jgi:hypothetical protein
VTLRLGVIHAIEGRYHALAKERIILLRYESLEAAHVSAGSFRSFPTSRRVRFTPRADIRPMPAFNAGSRLDLSWRWPSWLVATAANDRLNIPRHTSFAAASDCRTIAIHEYAPRSIKITRTVELPQRWQLRKRQTIFNEHGLNQHKHCKKEMLFH